MEFASFLHNPWAYPSKEEAAAMTAIRRKERFVDGYSPEIELRNLLVKYFGNLQSLHKFGLVKHFKDLQSEVEEKKLIGLIINCDPFEYPNNEFWDIINNNKKIGKVTSAVYSPRLEKNIALAIIESKYAKIGSRFKIGINDAFINCEQVSLPFYDPKKSLAKQ